MRLLTEQGRTEVENMDKFQERFLIILSNLTILFSLVLMGFGVFFSHDKEQSDSAVICGLFLFSVSSIFVTYWFKNNRG